MLEEARFSDAQEEQLRRVVRAAVQEEVWERVRTEVDRVASERVRGLRSRSAASELNHQRRRSRGSPGSRRGQDCPPVVSRGAAEFPTLAGERREPTQGGLGRGKLADEPVAAEECLETECESPIRVATLQSHVTSSALQSHRHIHALRAADTNQSFDALLNDALYVSWRAGEISWQQAVSLYTRAIVRNPAFDSVMGFIIMLNCVCIGVEVQLKLDNGDVGLVQSLDHVFLICFVIEALLRLIADGKDAFNSWFIFDVALVVCGVLISWIIQPTFNALDMKGLPLISQILTLRILRLLRTVRAFRTIDMFSEMVRLCSGLIRSTRTMLSVCLLVIVAVFSFAVIGVDLITLDPQLAANDDTHYIVQSYFSTLPTFMMTLMQFANGDSIASLYYPLCREQPLLVFYFLPVWTVLTVALMNLVTAIIVDSALAIGREEAEVKENKCRKILLRNLPNLEGLFDTIDEDRSGAVSISEIRKAQKENILVFPKEVKSMIDPNHLVEMFEFLDKDNSGEVDKEEFIDGVCCLALSSLSVETLQTLQLLRSCHYTLVDTHKNVKEILATSQEA